MNWDSICGTVERRRCRERLTKLSEFCPLSGFVVIRPLSSRLFFYYPSLSILSVERILGYLKLILHIKTLFGTKIYANRKLIDHVSLTLSYCNIVRTKPRREKLTAPLQPFCIIHSVSSLVLRFARFVLAVPRRLSPRVLPVSYYLSSVSWLS